MDVDVTGVAIDISTAIYTCFQTVEPKNTGRDEIGLSFAIGQFVEMLTDRDATFEDHTRGLTRADSFRNFVKPAGRAK